MAPATDDRLQEIWQAARAARPQIDVPAADFARYVVERLPSGADALAAVADIHTADLYLACACSRGDPAGLAVFEREFIAQVSTYLRRDDAVPGFADEVKQKLRATLLVRDGEQAPRIVQYSGLGPLNAWLRVAATRAAVDLRRARNPGDATALGMPETLRTAAPDAELSYLKNHYGPELRDAMAAALAALDARDATVLRLFFTEGMTERAIGAMYQVSERSARRWVANARQWILAETRKRLMDRLDVTVNQLDSIIRLVQDDLGPSIVELLKRPPDDR
jgi:RNA polymerase sigma-70 factor (ECF subfamily)